MAHPLVLVVDDDRDNREGVAEFLSGCGFRVAQAGEALEAFAQVRKDIPSAVVLDLQLPGIDGFEIARQLRENPETRHVRMIAFSACVFPVDRSRAIDAGCDEFVEKPASPTVIVQAIERLLGADAVPH